MITTCTTEYTDSSPFRALGTVRNVGSVSGRVVGRPKRLMADRVERSGRGKRTRGIIRRNELGHGHGQGSRFALVPRSKGGLVSLVSDVRQRFVKGWSLRKGHQPGLLSESPRFGLRGRSRRFPASLIMPRQERCSGVILMVDRPRRLFPILHWKCV